MCLSAGTSFRLIDQILDPHAALSRTDVLQKKKNAQPQTKDSRNLYLAKEGLITSGTAAAEGVSQSDLSKRLRLEQSKNQSLKNLNRFLSLERLTIHNIPPSYDSAKLRKVITKACSLKVSNTIPDTLQQPFITKPFFLFCLAQGMSRHARE